MYEMTACTTQSSSASTPWSACLSAASANWTFVTLLENGEVIEAYPDDIPYPSRLLLGTCEGRPIHVLASDDLLERAVVIITVYEPDPSQWDASFKRRR